VTSGNQARQKAEILARVRALTPAIRGRSEAAEAARRLPQESVDELVAAGIARMLVPARYGGYELGLDAWLEVVLEVAKADASHGWCASLIIHHPHYLAQFPQAAQDAVWRDGPDVVIATSLEPRCEVAGTESGYRVSGRSPFTSGILHSSWILVGGMLPDAAGAEPALFLIAPGEYEVDETWFTSAMRATGSNTAVTDAVFVPAEHVLRIADLREGAAPGAGVNSGVIYRAPWMSYATLTFAIPILGAAIGAYEQLRERMIERAAGAGREGALVRLARAAVDIDAAELLARRAIETAQATTAPSLELRARTMRDASRVAELALAALDALVALNGSAGFASANPVQRAWRDAHFAASHIALNLDGNFVHWARTALGVERPREQIFY
jgi:3-hydroxy-9,10-secoandrosta-1,3,5(10)-triene-9,17-dione monooxygenase